jgi:hypothetical protein
MLRVESKRVSLKLFCNPNVTQTNCTKVYSHKTYEIALIGGIGY